MSRGPPRRTFARIVGPNGGKKLQNGLSLVLPPGKPGLQLCDSQLPDRIVTPAGAARKRCNQEVRNSLIAAGRFRMAECYFSAGPHRRESHPYHRRGNRPHGSHPWIHRGIHHHGSRLPYD